MMDKTAAFEYGNQINNLMEIAENGGTEKTAMEHEFSNIVRAFIRETSFCEKILPPQEVTAEDRMMQISTTTKNETFEYIVFLEPDASAQVYSMTGTADSVYVNGDRVAIPIGTVSSSKFEKHEDELEIYRGVGLIKMVEQNAAKEVGDYQDDAFMKLSRTAVQGNGLDISSGGLGITKENFIDLINAPLQNHLRAKNVLMTETTFNNFFKQGSEVFGLTLQSEIIVDGYKENKILKVPVTTTIKNYIVNDDEIFAYPSPEFLGKFLTMGALKFRIKKNDGIVSWQCYKKWGLAFINKNGVARLKINGFTD